jgi:TolA-binding protein
MFLDHYGDHPNEIHVRYRIAQLWDAMGDPVEAVTAFSLVYNRQDAPIDLRYQAVRRVSALYTVDGDLELAAKSLLAASQLEVDNERRADALYFAAETWFKLQDYDEAARRYGEVVKTFGDTSVAEDAHFKQAQAHYFRKLYRKAAEAFKDFLVRWPTAAPERLAEATLQLGLAQSEARDQYTQAAETLANFAADWPDHERTSYALLLAAHAYLEHDRPVPAMVQLTNIIENFKDTKEYPYAIYWRSYLLLANGQPEQAEDDGVKFVIEHGKSHRELAAEVLLWLGHEVSDDQPTAAENYFLQLVKDFPDSRYAPEALYRAAENVYNQGRHANAIAYIDQLFADYPDGPERVKAQAWYLRGDMESTINRFKEAGEAYGACAALAKGSRLYYAAIGSRGDAYYSLAGLEGEGTDSYDEARKSYELIVNECKDESFVEMSRYRAAKIHEILARQQTDPVKREDHIDLASQYYFDIFFFYKSIDISANLVDWYYFSRAGFDLARLYVEDDRLEAAVTIYDLVGSARIPTAPDARKRAADLRRQQLD